jgi:hypothetical protein
MILLISSIVLGLGLIMMALSRSNVESRLFMWGVVLALLALMGGFFIAAMALPASYTYEVYGRPPATIAKAANHVFVEANYRTYVLTDIASYVIADTATHIYVKITYNSYGMIREWNAFLIKPAELP